MARRAIELGQVRVEGIVDPKPATRVSPDTAISVDPAASRFVSRAGEKLEGALDRFDVPVAGMDAIDVGASTGGFTDCLLQRGAASVVAVDVGSDQLHAVLRDDPRVTSYEQCDIREFRRGRTFDVVVADVSFISLGTLAPTLAALGSPGSDWIVLTKPQFEVGPQGRDRRGVVGDGARRADAVGSVVAAFEVAGLVLCGFTPSVVSGGAGNREYLLWMRRRASLARVTAGDQDGSR